VVVGQTLGDNRIRQDIAVALGIKTALAVPIRVNNQLFGAVMVLNRLDAGELTDRDSLLVEEYLNSLLRDEG
jgi:GAF domain-containing protein